MSSQVNEEMTEGCIEEMGLKLAKEIEKYINEWCYSKDGKKLLISKITFVGHSLGGIIIRSALPHLE